MIAHARSTHLREQYWCCDWELRRIVHTNVFHMPSAVRRWCVRWRTKCDVTSLYKWTRPVERQRIRLTQWLMSRACSVDSHLVMLACSSLYMLTSTCRSTFTASILAYGLTSRVVYALASACMYMLSCRLIRSSTFTLLDRVTYAWTLALRNSSCRPLTCTLSLYWPYTCTVRAVCAQGAWH